MARLMRWDCWHAPGHHPPAGHATAVTESHGLPGIHRGTARSDQHTMCVLWAKALMASSAIGLDFVPELRLHQLLAQAASCALQNAIGALLCMM